MKKVIGILSPVYNEREVIARFHSELLKAISPLETRYEFRITYVVDPSNDGTEKILAEIAQQNPRVRVIVLSRRFGHQSSLLAGLDQFQGDALIMMDCDLQHPPSLIPELLSQYEQGAEIVQTLRSDAEEIGLLKRVTSKRFYQIMNWMTSIHLRPGSADYRLLSNRVVEVFKTKIRERNPFLRGLVAWVGYRMVYVSFQCPPRTEGRSKYKVSTLFAFALNGVFSFSKKPLRICMTFGLVVASLSFVGLAAQLIYYFSQPTRVAGWASLYGVVTFMGGVQLLFMGMIGEYVGQIYDEAKARPTYLIDRIHGNSK